jgi:hypothetical protein
MEFKVVIYIVGAVIYFIYNARKKALEKQQSEPQHEEKTVNAPNPLEDIMREMKRKQMEYEATQKQQENTTKPITPYQPKPNTASKTVTPYTQQSKTKPKPQPQVVAKQKVKGKDILIHESKSTYFEEGRTNTEAIYERELTEEEKIIRGDLKLEDEEGIYRIESIEEAEARSEKEERGYPLNLREAVIGSLILERKF